MYIKTAEYILKDRINMNATIVRVSNRPERPRGKKNKTYSSSGIKDGFRVWPI